MRRLGLWSKIASTYKPATPINLVLKPNIATISIYYNLIHIFELTTSAKHILDIMVGAVSSSTSAFSYTLTHHVHNPFDPYATGYAIRLGTFLTVTDAREATKDVINKTIRKLLDFGFMDFSKDSRDVDEWTMELVTISKFDGEEGVLSRFIVEEEVIWVCRRVDVAVEQPENAAVVRLTHGDTGLEIDANREEAFSHHYPAFEEERAASWAQSWMPHLIGRDEHPFHYGRNDTGRQEIMDQEERHKDQQGAEQKNGQGKENEQAQGRDETSEDAEAAQHSKGLKKEDADKYEDHVQGKQSLFSS